MTFVRVSTGSCEGRRGWELYLPAGEAAHRDNHSEMSLKTEIWVGIF
jgi:hypothetical protein